MGNGYFAGSQTTLPQDLLMEIVIMSNDSAEVIMASYHNLKRTPSPISYSLQLSKEKKTRFLVLFNYPPPSPRLKNAYVRLIMPLTVQF